jgi:hypothetical protein
MEDRPPGATGARQPRFGLRRVEFPSPRARGLRHYLRFLRPVHLAQGVGVGNRPVGRLTPSGELVVKGGARDARERRYGAQGAPPSP